MPPVEAMACGCPVISSARGALGEILGSAAIRIDPEDMDALAGQLCLLSALAVRARTVARRRFPAGGAF